MDTVRTPEGTGTFPKLVTIDEGQIKSHVDQVVRESVEQTLNGLLDAEADRLCGAGRYERSADRVDTRAGHYTRSLTTTAGDVELKVPLPRYGSPQGVRTSRRECVTRGAAGEPPTAPPQPGQQSGKRASWTSSI